jgi:hypothetical protein
MLKNKNNFEIINLFFHYLAKNFSKHPCTSHIRSEVYIMLKIHTVVFWFTTYTRLHSVLTQKNT